MTSGARAERGSDSKQRAGLEEFRLRAATPASGVEGERWRSGKEKVGWDGMDGCCEGDDVFFFFFLGVRRVCT